MNIEYAWSRVNIKGKIIMTRKCMLKVIIDFIRIHHSSCMQW